MPLMTRQLRAGWLVAIDWRATRTADPPERARKYKWGLPSHRRPCLASILLYVTRRSIITQTCNSLIDRFTAVTVTKPGCRITDRYPLLQAPAPVRA